MTGVKPFRPNKKIGQIFVNIPGGGSFSVEATGHPDSLNAALQAASLAFWDVYAPKPPAPSAGGDECE